MLDLQWIIIFAVLLIPHRIDHDRVKSVSIIKTPSWELKMSKKGFSFELRIVSLFYTLWSHLIEIKAKEKLASSLRN